MDAGYENLLALIGQVVLENMIKNNGNIHINSPGAGVDNLIV